MIALPILLLLGADPRLDRPVDLRLKLVSVETAVAAMGREAGIPMDTSPAVRGAKTTILVKGLPLGRVMARVADAMRLRWSREGDAYRLVADPDAAAREAAFLESDFETRRKALEKEMRDRAARAPLSHREVLEEVDEIEKTLNAIGADAPQSASLFERRRGLYENYDPEYWLQNRMLAGLGESEWTRLFAGETLSASTAPIPGGRRLPTEVVGEKISQFGQGKIGRCDLYLKVNPDECEFVFRYDAADEGGGPVHTSIDRWGSRPNPEGSLGETPLAKELQAWNTDDAALAKGPLANMKPTVSTPERPSGWWSGYRSDADRLEWMHDATGLPIVAMALRKPNPKSALRFSGSVAAEIKTWRRGGDAFRFEDGVLMHRPPEFWRRKSLEIHEETLARLEAKPSPSLDDYAEFVTHLSERQVRHASDPRSVLLKVSPRPLSNGRPALRLWGTLSLGQRNILRNGGALPYGALGSSAKAAYVNAVTDVFTGAPHLGTISTFIVNGETSSRPWVLFGTTKDISSYGSSKPRPLDAPNDEMEKVEVEPRVDAILLTLGLSRTDGVQYSLPLAGAPRSGSEPRR